MENIIISNPTEFKLKKQKFISGGAKSIQVVSDFDKTLTTAVYNGTKTNTAISQMRQNNLLGEEYAKKSFDLFNKYYPIEIDSSIPEGKKIPLMEEWWSNHLKIIVEYGMSRKVVEEVINIQSKYLRGGAKDFFKILFSNGVPLLILSSALGDVIEGVLKKHKFFTENIYVISNYFDFNDVGKAIGYKGKIVHVFNKDESQIKNTPYFEKISKRKNILLLGDSVGDLKMTDQIDFDEIIRIGFLNENIKQNFKEYKKYFDVIILNDGPLDFVNSLLKELFE